MSSGLVDWANIDHSVPAHINMNGNLPESFVELTEEEFMATQENLEAMSNSSKPRITLYFLQSSRSIRIAWLLEELHLEYNVICYDREQSMAAPIAFKEACGGSMGKAPVLVDGDLILQESGAITQ